MIFQIIEENGVKKIQALSADTGTGAPVGSYLMLEKKSNPQGYLYCDGSTFDTSAYPALYQYLGTNKLPDCREFAFVGAEENTTNVYNASTNPNGVIHDHDVFTEGQCKDDQIQNITGQITTVDYQNRATENGALKQTPIPLQNSSSQGTAIYLDEYNVVFDASKNARAGTVTRGKRKAVFIYIKATSGLTENQQENVLNTINENLSYSTTEHKTGKKWIDGKDTYQAVVENITVTTSWGVITAIGNVVDSLINVIPVLTAGNVVTNVQKKVDNNYIYLAKSSSDIVESTKFIFEYTKTTDN